MDVYEAARAVSIDRRETGSSRAGTLKRTREEKAPLTGPFALASSGPPDRFTPQLFRKQHVAADPVFRSEISVFTDPVLPGSYISALDIESQEISALPSQVEIHFIDLPPPERVQNLDGQPIASDCEETRPPGWQGLNNGEQVHSPCVALTYFRGIDRNSSATSMVDGHPQRSNIAVSIGQLFRMPTPMNSTGIPEASEP